MKAVSAATCKTAQPVIVAAGGTGGHVVPALAVAQVLESHSVPVVWMGTQAGLEARMVPAHGIDIRWISIGGLRGKSLLTTALAPVKLIRAVVQSLLLMIDLKPRAVLGMGGFVSGPVGIAALILRKPLVLHEQNAVAGMTNRWLSPLASRVFCAFPGAFKSKVNAQVVGNPVLRVMSEYVSVNRSSIQADGQALKILVVGGSRGARVLNEVVPAAIAQLNSRVSVHHQSGAGESGGVRKRYQPSGNVDVQVSDFIDDMTRAYEQADVVVCRSGAMTVTELSALAVPSILVPFPFAVDDHQSVNARHLADQGAAIVMPQATFTPENLAQELLKLIDNPQKLIAMSDAAARCFTPDAAQRVASALMEVSA